MLLALRYTLRKLLHRPTPPVSWQEVHGALMIADGEGIRRGWQWSGFAVRKGLRNYVVLLENRTGSTMKVRIGVSDGAIKQVTIKSR